ncbi:sialate O-acetylesterase [Povalibacter uvarum]|uniref:Sialate O-acetylesterase n=1 Tax=Povalibacter uvarum TaxID=732238 RepID=A0A841HQ21_9GAMM|nr:sialate O-acetylesterase [Povalibacter uvarum]MBB6094863.1 sialate O-acetylesterase [Povalibacter uvarum]
MRTWLLAALLLPMGAAAADLLSPLFQDHAVLQRDRPVRLWGNAPSGSDVTVEIAGQRATAKADGSGEWHLSLSPLRAGGPHVLTARSSSGAIQTVRDVLIGDVWLCSGQSNMEMPMRLVSNSITEIDESSNDRIRLLTIARASSAVPRKTLSAPVAWSAASPETVRDFAAACYFLGRDLLKAQGVPQGLIHSSWGGSIIQAWTSASSMRGLGYDDAINLLDLHVRSPREAQQRWYALMEKWWQQNDPNAGRWNAVNVDDTGWSTIVPDDFWEKSGGPELKSFDGILWYRTTVTLDAKQAAQDATISLGPVDDLDSTWVNGVRLGSLEGWNTPREYRIARGVLKVGKNVIAVGALDAGGGGGMWGTAPRKLTFADGSVLPIDGEWRYRISAPLTQTGAPPHAPWLESSGSTTLYNAMIAPLGNLSLRGVAWYQGESNSSESAEYARLLPAMMRDWRSQFGAETPFLIVQLAGFGPAAKEPSPASWADIREVQRRVVASDNHAALITTIDIGDRYDIHPTNKQEVGRRLALAARREIFDEPVSSSGPDAVSAERSGGHIVVKFANATGGLVVIGGNRPLGFELCNAKKDCRFVDAMVHGDRVVLDAAADDAFVRYGWADSPVCNLYNDADLPAVPFEIAVTR